MIMLSITILLFAALVYRAHLRKVQRWQRIKRGVAQWEGGEG